MGSIDSIEPYAYRTRKGLICEKEKIKRNNIKRQYKDFDFDYITKEDNTNWPKILIIHPEY